MAIRVKHRSLHSCVYVVELDTPYSTGKPHFCPTCRKEHQRKALHLRLDSEGYTFISSTTSPELRRVLEAAGLEPVNEVGKPPGMAVGAISQPKLEVATKSNGHLERQTLASHFVPGVTRYESRDIMWAPWQPAIDDILTKLDKIKTAEKAQKRTIVDLGKGGK